MAPYLQALTPTSVTVMVECRSAQPVVVEFGKTNSYGNRRSTTSTQTTTASTVVHRIVLNDLTPNTIYHYRAVIQKETSDDASFITASTNGGLIRFAWMADCRTGTMIHDTIAARILRAEPRFSLYGGDLCVNPEYTSFKTEFFRPNERALIARVPFFLAPGNHEDWDLNTKAFTDAPPSPSGTKAYYSFDYGPVHVLVLNTEVGYGRKSEQFAFASSDLASTKKPWKIVIAHKPAYGSGGHGEDKLLKHMTSEIFEPNHVTFFLAGHSHYYQHNSVNGIHHLIIGSAGAPLYSPSSKEYTVKAIKDYNYAIAEADSININLVVYNDRGAQLDRISLQKKK